MRNFRYWLPVILAMTFIYWMSTDAFAFGNTAHIVETIVRFFAPHLPRKTMLLIHHVARKLSHVTEYFILGLLLFRAFRAGSEERRWWRWALSSLCIVALYAGGDELHQYFVSSRTASLVDVGYDALGGMLAQCSSIVWYGRRQRDEKERTHGKAGLPLSRE